MWHAIYLLYVEKDKILFKDEVEAWQYGPVIVSVYDKYKNYGSGIIHDPNDKQETQAVIPQEDLEIIDLTLAHYGDMSGIKLIHETHSEDPWKNAYYGNTDSKIISTDLMKEYYKSIYSFSE